MGLYGFDPKKDTGPLLMFRAREKNITVTPWGLVRIERGVCQNGLRSSRVFTYHTYREALRSFQHIVDTILIKAADLREQSAEFQKFHSQLLDPPVDKEEISTKLAVLVGRFTKVHCENLVALGRHLKDKTLLDQSLVELVEGKYWGAASTKLVFSIMPKLAQERLRRLDQIEHVVAKEQILGKIWAHELWLGETLYETVVEFGSHLDRELLLDEPNTQELTWKLNQILINRIMARPFDYRLKNTQKSLKDLKISLEKINAVGEEARARAKKHLRAAIWNINRYRKWLNMTDSNP